MEQKQRVIASGLEVSVVGAAFLCPCTGLSVESMSSTTRSESSCASACATNSRFTAISPSRFSSLASSSASKLCRREVSAPPRSQFFFEPIRRKVGSAEKRDLCLDRSRKSVGLMLSIALCGRTVLSLVPRVLRFPLGQVTRPILHQDTPPLEQVRAGIGGFDLIPDNVRQRRLHDRHCGASVHSAAQSRKLERNPCGTAAIWCLRITVTASFLSIGFV